MVHVLTFQWTIYKEVKREKKWQTFRHLSSTKYQKDVTFV